MSRKPRVFLSHASEDKEQVREIYGRLRESGFQPWLDEVDLLPGQVWKRVIPRAIKKSDCVLVFFSQAAVAKRGYLQKEFRLVLDTVEEMPPDRIFVIPVRLDPCEVPEDFRDYVWADLFKQGGFERICRSIRLATPERPAGEVQSKAEAERVLQEREGPPDPGGKGVIERLGREATLKIEGVPVEFVSVKPGSFQMGSESGGSNEKPVRTVVLTRGFELGKYPVTQLQWEAVMGSHPSRFKGPDRPVVGVSWEDAGKFMGQLNGRDDSFHYRLPTEAEWEYAARAGTTGDFAGKLDKMAWYGKNSGGETHPVGQKQPNAWGLYDMHGNVWEWVQDWYKDDYYSIRPDPDPDPEGPEDGVGRVFRGGGWGNSAANCRSASRVWGRPSFRHGGLGFRLLRHPQ